MALASSGTCTYNGTAFNSLYKSTVSSKPILDGARRAVAYVEHTLEVEGYIIGQPTDPSMAAIRKSLTAVAGALTYKNKGFGDLVVNGASPVRDACWGPIPELLDFVPLGGDCNAARVTWRCTTRIPECDFARYRFAVVAFNYEVDYDIDQDGYTTCRISGYLEIPMTRLGVNIRAVPDSADRYRSFIRPEVPLGFHRKQQSFRLSADKRRLDFNFQDEEIPTALPDGCSAVEARESVESQLAKNAFRQWSITISATITLARGVPKSDALEKFWLIVRSRTRINGMRGANGGPMALLPLRLRMEDEITGRSSSFSMTLICYNATLQQILNVSGMWTPIPGTDYQRWAQSLRNSASHERGYAQLAHTPDQDAIVDLCLGGNNLRTLQSRTVPPAGANLRARPRPDEDLTVTLRGLRPENAWLAYAVQLTYVEDPNLIAHKPLPRPPSVLRTFDPNELGQVPPHISSAAEFAGLVGGLQAPTGDGSYPPDRFQRTALPTRHLVLTGYGVRLAWRVTPPALDTVGGVPAVEVGRQVTESQPGAIGAVLVFRTDWQITYRLGSGPDGALPYLPNPAIGTDGSTDVASPTESTLRTVGGS